MNKKKIIAILIFLLCVSIPYLILSMFPSSMGNDIYCMLFYYPLLFLIGGLSAWAYNQFRDRVKLNKAVLLLLILLLDFTILTSFYPKGQYSPINQLRVARQVTNDYKNLKPVDIFKAIDDRNFLRITALYHKFNLPPEFYIVRYCFNDTKTKGIYDPYSCDTMYKEFDYFFMDNRVVTNNPDFDYNLDLNEGSFSFTDTVEKIDFNIKFGYPNFGANGRFKEIETLRVIVFETKPTFEYGFTNLFEQYLNKTQ